MAGKTRKKQVRGEYTRISLLEAATELFAAHGYEGTSVKQITEKAGASVGSFYHHFNDKADLFTRVLDNGSMTLRRFFRKVRNLPPDVSLEARTYRAYAALLEFATEHRSLWVLLLLETEKLPLPIREIVKQDQELYLREHAQDLEAAVKLGRLKPLDARLGAEAVFGMSVHMLSQYLNDPDADRETYVDAMARAAVGILRAMAGSRHPAWIAPDKVSLRAG
ncbi:MAG: TetR/AcrR family transcriptional regulator [Desulfatibacillum sp.]|nr:TetR/AcrR family transcriptional regulator [Desulfatibacillum sp.]